MMKIITLGLMASALTLSVNVSAGDAAAGKAKSAVCATCHGAAGISSIDMYPNLAGQKKTYLVNALKAYKSKARSGGLAVIMQAQVSNLSDQDIDNLATYYNSL
ncbi:MAG: cytochrome c553 [Oleiphilaceae bacterium]|jgi:cytochrome c553